MLSRSKMLPLGGGGAVSAVPVVLTSPPPCTPGDPGTIPPPGALTPRRGGAHTGSIAVAPAAGTRMGGPLAELWGRAGARR